MPRITRRRQAEDVAVDGDSEIDVVLDLTDRLEPYRGTAVRPLTRVELPPEEPEKPQLWEPLEFDFPYRSAVTPEQ